MKVALLLIGALTFSGSRAQGPAAQQAAAIPVAFAGIPTPAPPEWPGAWSIVVATRGVMSYDPPSFTTVTSEGVVTCRPQWPFQCVAALRGQTVDEMSELVALSMPLLNLSELSACNDCVRTFLLLSRRDEAGRVQTRTGHWDQGTLGRVPQNLVHLAQSMVNTLRVER